MRGVKYFADVYTFLLGEESSLTFYDADLNDPPLELLGDVEDWVREKTPEAVIDYRELFDIRIRFASEKDALLFKTWWL